MHFDPRSSTRRALTTRSAPRCSWYFWYVGMSCFPFSPLMEYVHLASVRCTSANSEMLRRLWEDAMEVQFWQCITPSMTFPLLQGPWSKSQSTKRWQRWSKRWSTWQAPLDATAANGFSKMLMFFLVKEHVFRGSLFLDHLTDAFLWTAGNKLVFVTLCIQQCD